MGYRVELTFLQRRLTNGQELLWKNAQLNKSSEQCKPKITRYHLITSRMLLSKRNRMWRNWNPCTLLVRLQKGITLTVILGIYPKEFKSGSQRGIYTPMFIAALVTITKIWKLCKCQSTDEWILKNEVWQTTECYSVLKKKRNKLFSMQQYG